MNDVLAGLDIEKKDRIVNAALQEFSENGFKKGSTNNIVKIAGISKGSLFHYFSSKLELYEYLIDFTFTNIMKAIKTKLDWQNGDIMERIKQIIIIKLNFIDRYPMLYKFMALVYKDFTSIEDIQELIVKYDASIYTRIYTENIDHSLIKDELDLKNTINTIQWSIEKMSEEKFNEFKSLNKDVPVEDMIESINDYVDYLKLIFYK